MRTTKSSAARRDDAPLYAFLKERSKQYKLPTAKGTRDLFVKNVDDNILRVAFAGVVSQQIRGNEGMHQMAVTLCARRSTPILRPRNGSTGSSTERRRGARPDRRMSSIATASRRKARRATRYVGRRPGELGERLADYPHYTKHNLFKEFPQLRAAFTAAAA